MGFLVLKPYFHVHFHRHQPTRFSTTLKRQKIKVEKQMLMPPTLLPTCWAPEVQSCRARRKSPAPLLPSQRPLCPWLQPFLPRGFPEALRYPDRLGPKRLLGPCPLNHPLTKGTLCVPGVNSSVWKLLPFVKNMFTRQRKGWKVYTLHTAEKFCYSLCVL